MTTKHNFTYADELYQGGGNFPPIFGTNGRNGAPVNLITKVSLGAPALIVTDGIIKAATTTELPNTETVTYTAADRAVSPMDSASVPALATIQPSIGGSASVFNLATPRNLILTVTHGSSVVAMTCVITGYDVWGQKMAELFTITAGTTSKTATGKKAFKTILSIAFTAAGNAEANTANLGWGDVLGLPYALAGKSDIVAWFENDAQVLPTTVVVADSTTATASTGDVRGTIAPTAATDGTKTYFAWINVADKSTTNGLKGYDQYSG